MKKVAQRVSEDKRCFKQSSLKEEGVYNNSCTFVAGHKSRTKKQRNLLPLQPAITSLMLEDKKANIYFKKEGFYQIIAESTQNYIFLVDKNGRIKYLNYFAAKALGKTKNEVIGHSLKEFFPPKIYTHFRKNIQKTLSSKKPHIFEERVLFPTSRELWLYTYLIPLKDKARNEWLALGISQDITKRKKSREKLRESETLFRTLAENSLAGIYIIQDNKFLYVNPAIGKIFGYKPKEIIARLGPLDLTHPQEREKVKEQIRRRVEREVDYVHYTFRGLRKDGTTVDCEVLGRYIKIGSRPAIIGTLLNITERKRAEEELRYRIEFENLITTIATNFINLELNQIDRGINQALQKIGEFAQVDRSYIFLASPDQKTIHNTHEWCAPGVRPQIAKYSSLPLEYFPWFAQKIRNLKTIYISSISQLPPEAEIERQELLEEGVRSLLIVPLVSEGSPIGVLGFDSLREEKVWSQEIIALLKIVAEMIVNALERKRMEEALKKSEMQYRLVINSIGDAIHVIDRNFKIVLANPSLFNLNQELGLETDVIGKNLFQVYPFLSKKVKDDYQIVFDSGRVLITLEENRVKNKEIILEVRKIPLWKEDKVVQVLTIIRDISQQKMAEKKLKTLYRKLVSSNKQLKQMALIDIQTGLFNRKFLVEAIESEFQRAKRYQQPFSLIMLDIDYFRSINEAYGHRFGDLVLKQLARELKKLVRRYDIVIRAGGEEFAIILPGTAQSAALLLAQRISSYLNLLHFGNREQKVKLKLSLAVISYPEDNLVKSIELLELGEEILAKVKQAGGNKVYSSKDLGSKTTPAGDRKKEISDVRILEEKINLLTKEVNQSIIEAIFAFAKTIELKDHYTGKHVERTVYYASEIAKALKLPLLEIEKIKQAAILHDLGKIGISEKILFKKSSLSKREFEKLKMHPQIGVEILRPIHFLHGILNLILYHHERWDGKGYPKGLKGEEIPLGARIIAIADVYQALISNRSYRRAYPASEALKIIREGAGTHFDPKITEIFLQILQRDLEREKPTA